MIYIAIETDRPTLELVKTALVEAAVSFEDMAIDADREESRHKQRDQVRLGDDGLHVKGERQIVYRANAVKLRDFWQQLV